MQPGSYADADVNGIKMYYEIYGERLGEIETAAFNNEQSK